MIEAHLRERPGGPGRARQARMLARAEAAQAK